MIKAIKYNIKYLPALAFMLLSSAVFSQTQNDLVGEWTVSKIILPDNIKPDAKEQLSGFSNALLQSKFHFQYDNGFVLDCPYPQLAFKSGKWNYDGSSQTISIHGKDAAGNNLPTINFRVKIDQGKYLFIMTELPFTLQVEKR